MNKNSIIAQYNAIQRGYYFNAEDFRQLLEEYPTLYGRFLSKYGSRFYKETINEIAQQKRFKFILVCEIILEIELEKKEESYKYAPPGTYK